jgi:hypothetical protein
MAGAAGAAAAQQRKMQHEEEERMTDYRPSDLEGWEFKIVRSASRIVGDQFVRLCEEEATNGWELVEKFDNHRIRFKRRIEKRQQDGYSSIDPYRTSFGLTEGRLALIIVLITFGLMGLIMFLAFSFSS